MNVIIRIEKIQKLVHEYKNLVNSICLGVSLIQKQLQKGELKSQKAVQILVDNSHRLQKSSVILTELIRIQSKLSEKKWRRQSILIN